MPNYDVTYKYGSDKNPNGHPKFITISVKSGDMPSAMRNADQIARKRSSWYRYDSHTEY